MAKFSKKVMGKEVGQAEVYAAPHTMQGQMVKIQDIVKGGTGSEELKRMNVSVGNISAKTYPETKTSGIKIRGTGAATKGVMARGPMG